MNNFVPQRFKRSISLYTRYIFVKALNINYKPRGFICNYSLTSFSSYEATISRDVTLKTDYGGYSPVSSSIIHDFKMKIIIVGAGIAGLSLAIALGQSKHDVTILDAAAALEELGAGVQMTPQAVRYFFQWGLKDDVISQSYTPKEMIIKDWEDGSVLSAVPTGKMAEEYGAPYILIHRGNLLTILHQHALKVGAKLRLSSRVANYVFEEGIVELENGEKLHADLVIAADGEPPPFYIATLTLLTALFRYKFHGSKEAPWNIR